MRKVNRTPIPKEFRTLKEAGEFWDTHSAADDWDQMEDVEMQIDITSRRFVIALDDAIYRAARERAMAEHLSLKKTKTPAGPAEEFLIADPPADPAGPLRGATLSGDAALSPCRNGGLQLPLFRLSHSPSVRFFIKYAELKN